MGEQLSTPEPDLTLRPEEPETFVRDPEKARFLADATKTEEESVVNYKRVALGQLGAYCIDSAKESLEIAQETRKVADRKADNIAPIYDRIKSLK